MICKICNTKLNFFDSSLILNKYKIQYYKCENCGIICTEKPYWLEESYSTAITSSDIGIISRNFSFTEGLKRIIPVIFPTAKSFLDYGGGYGIFVRRMRDLGFDFEWYDKYCENIFAKGHEQKKNHYNVVTAFELFEHLEDPVNTCKELLSLGDNLIFSTELLPVPNPKPQEWWYYCTDHGQHIFFYEKKSLEMLAKMYNKHYYSINGFHIFSSEVLNIKEIKWKLSAGLIGKIYRRLNRDNRTSLLESDYKNIVS